MQRISVVHTRPGMILANPVFDNWGDIIIEEGIKLEPKDIDIIMDNGIGEIFITNENTPDLNLKTIIDPQLSGALSKALRRVIIETRTTLTSKSHQNIDINPLISYTKELISELSIADIGDASINGCFSLKDYNYVHPVKVSAISLLIGIAEGLTENELINMGLAALFQNIGYVLIPQGILEKSGPLNDIELQIVQKHPTYGMEILQRYTEVDQMVIDIIMQHHERWNGKGYPNQLKHDSITKPAQIIGIVDTCFALASKRPHREEFLPSFAIEQSIVSAQDAIEFILAYSGELFNPDLVRTFSSQIPVYPKGVKIRLNNGKEGMVCHANSGILRRPKVRIQNRTVRRTVSATTEGRTKGQRQKIEATVDHTWRDLDLTKNNQKRTFIVETLDY